VVVDECLDVLQPLTDDHSYIKVHVCTGTYFVTQIACLPAGCHSLRLSVWETFLAVFQYRSVEAPAAANEALPCLTSCVSAATRWTTLAFGLRIDSHEFTATLRAVRLCLQMRHCFLCSSDVVYV